MKQFERKSRLRSTISSLLAVAMIMSIVAIPAFASTDATVTSYAPGTTGLANVVTSVNPGLNGVVKGSVEVTPATQAMQESNAFYATDVNRGAVLGADLHLASTTGDYQLRLNLISARAGGLYANDPGYIFTLPVSLTTTMTVAQAVTAMQSTLDSFELTGTVANVPFASDQDKIDANLALRATAAFVPSTGRIRLVKTFAEGGAEIWADDLRTGPTDGAADLIFGLGQAGGNNLVNFGRHDGFFYQVGADNMFRSLEASFTPTGATAKPYLLGRATHVPSFGGITIGAYESGVFVPGAVDPATGFWTAVDIFGALDNAITPPTLKDWNIGLMTNTGVSLTSGLFQMALGNGVIDTAAQRCGDTEADFPSVLVTPANGSIAGKNETYTIEVPSNLEDVYPYTLAENGFQNAIDGVRILFPKAWTPAASNAPTVTMPADPPAMRNTASITTSVTAFGPMLDVSNIWIPGGSGDIQVSNAVFTLPTNASLDGIAQVWIHQVGSDRWMPITCLCPPAVNVNAGPAKTVSVFASDNRAGGFSWVRAYAKDAFGNDVSVSMGDLAATISPSSDGAMIQQPYANEWKWKLAATEGSNTVTVKYVPDTTVLGSATVSTVGVTDPIKLVIRTFDDIGSSHYFLELRDANNHATSFADGDESHPFKAKSVNLDGDIDRADVDIFEGWAISSYYDGTFGGSLPTEIELGPFMNGPDTVTLTASSNQGLVMPAPFFVVDVPAPAETHVPGVPFAVKVTADKQAPAEFAKHDQIYNKKWSLKAAGIDDTAFGYAEGNPTGEDFVKLTAQVVDFFGTPVTSHVASIPVTFDIENWSHLNGTLASPDATGSIGHTWTTKTNGSGQAVVLVRAYRPTKWLQDVPNVFALGCNRDVKGTQTDGPEELDSWFTPVKVTVPGLNTTGEDLAGIGEACTGQTQVCGWGFAYFHGGEMETSLQKTIEGKDKNIVLADGVDTTTYTATVMDTAFDTPIAGWDVRFTTDFGSLDTSGTKTIEKQTGADGKTSVTAFSMTAGDADLVAVDRLRKVEDAEVKFTDYAAKSEVLEPTMRAGDRAEANVRVWWENIKTGARVMWSMDDAHFHFGWDKFGVYGNAKDEDGNAVVGKTNFAADDGNFTEVDTNADGKFDAIEFGIPAKDIMPSSWDDIDRLQLESAGVRWALVQGRVEGKTWVGNVFYDKFNIVAAPARPQVDFVKESTVKAEGTQFSVGLSMIGDKFTAGSGAPDFMDRVKIYLGDITTGDRTKKLTDLGTAFVGRDGVLLPVVVGNDCIKQLAPGLYDITVDGLVFKNGLEIKNMFDMASVLIGDAKRDSAGTYFLDPNQSINHPLTKYKLNVNAFGNKGMEVWAGNTKLVQTQESGLFILHAERLPAGYSNVTAKVYWPDNNGGSYTTVVNAKVWRQSPVRFSYPTMTGGADVPAGEMHSFTIRGSVTGILESNGKKISSVRIGVQRLVNHRWVTYAYRTVKVASNGKFAGIMKVGPDGRYRAFVYHSDLSHGTTMRTGTALIAR